MPSTVVRLVRPTTPPLNASDERRRFWRAYLRWLATASDAEIDRLEQVLADHALHVRPLVHALHDAFSDHDNALRLPSSLLSSLVACACWSEAAGPREGCLVA